ncbi:MAG TPA: alanine dehydrogenase [Chloroflexi bacterium]|jgi:alanine dehydrogenase|nr:alanine dehydrogenase [Chloroflexota bacterium]
MIIGVPKEIKDNEYRVALTPGVAESLTHAGHRVLVETGAGENSGFFDDDYVQSGCEILPSATEVYGTAEMVVKVKEPLPEEYDLLRPGLMLFTYLHLAAEEDLTHVLLEKQVTGIAYETVQRADGSLPLLTPMSEIAGKMAVQIGAHHLEKTQGGRGILLGGVPGVLPSNVVIIGGGVVGTNAAQVALGLGARVTIIDINLDRLRYLNQVMQGRLNVVASNRRNIADAVRRAELLIGAVLVPGAKAPVLVPEELVTSMAPGSVVIDVAVDQGGCIETSHPTSHSAPTYEVGGVIHYAVPNMPGVVPRTATYALSNATLPYIQELAGYGLEEAVRRDAALARGVNTYAGHIVHKAVAEAFDIDCASLDRLLNGRAPAGQ